METPSDSALQPVEPQLVEPVAAPVASHISPTSSDAAEAIDALFGTPVNALVDAIGIV